MNNDTQDNRSLFTRRDAIKMTGGAAAAIATTSSLFSGWTLHAQEIATKITPGMTVAQYILSRLKELGVKHTFGVPGDYLYDVCDAVEDDPDIQGVWCSNELNAGYAADGYGRTNGIGVGLFTMGAELSPLQSMAGANAENVKVLHITALPSEEEMAAGYRGHHQFAGMAPDRYDLFAKMAEPLTAGGNSVAVITPENCVFETERLIAAMLYHSKPALMAIPRLTAKAPVVAPRGELNIPLADPKSDPSALDAAVREILRLIKKAKRAVWLPGYAIRRYNCVAEAKSLIEASGLPFFSGLQDMSVLSEQHPQFGGLYLGRWKGLADFAVSDFIEGSDCIIGIGPENHSFNNAFHTVKDELNDTINIMPHETRIGFAVYRNVEMKDVLKELAGRIAKRSDVPVPKYKGWVQQPAGSQQGDDISYDDFYSRLQSFLRPNDIFVGCVSLCAVCGPAQIRKPDGVNSEGQHAFGMLGWGTAAMLGNTFAAEPDRRCVILTGEGAHQMTANELGTFGRYKRKPVFIVVNNNGYGAERVTNRYPDEAYNDVSQWDYAKLPATLGCKDWLAKKVSTIGELEAALSEASKADTGVYLEVTIDRDLQPKGGDWLFGQTGGYFGLAGRTWEDWLREGRKLKV